MEKYFNTATITFGVIGGFFMSLLGGLDNMLYTLIFLVVVDYLTGVLGAIYHKNVSSELGYKGIIKKVFMFVIVAVAVAIEQFLLANVGVLGESIPIREMVIMFFIANEGISLLENAGTVLPIPEKLKDVFIQIRDKEEKVEGDVE